MTTLERLAQYADRWLSTESRGDQVMWIWVENREAGVDLARRMFQLRFGDFALTEVPYDTLPTYAANASTNNRVFILSQPSHAETCLVTMAPDNAEMYTRPASEAERAVQYLRRHGDPETALEVDFLDQTMRPDQFQVKAPDILVVDMEEPYWDILRMYIQPTTNVTMTDRVKVQPPRKLAL